MKWIPQTDPAYPPVLTLRLSETAPEALAARGESNLLRGPKIALFCSIRCPGDVILKTYDLAQRWREEGVTVISGFHSPIEKECLRILLRGKQPIVICPARSLEGMRLSSDWKDPLIKGRLLLLSPFATQHRRITADLAKQRNEFVAALADEICITHASSGGELEKLTERISRWGIPIINLG